MNLYAASVALLWTTAMRATAPPHRGVPPRVHSRAAPRRDAGRSLPPRGRAGE